MNEADRAISIDRVSSRSAVREHRCLALKEIWRNGTPAAGKHPGYRTHINRLICDIPAV